ncbi:hypothetical protein SteCoe_16292 [Stentor coeruleus]|uniref:Uncharacterized protein n=1 Tax=Stentor coeruleus TaxID=5963 RepID=A0A1R2C1T4_9CILI|nr:hypothetical protein SteCoe_16292 [Stentor coeruleus]
MSDRVDAETESIYTKTMNLVINQMNRYLQNNNYSDDIIRKIQSSWKENLSQIPRSKFSYISPFKLQALILKPAVIVKVDEPPLPPPKVESEHSESDEYSFDDDIPHEHDPNLDVFNNLQMKQQEAKKIVESKVEITESFSEEDSPESDDETKLDCPEPTGVIHCMICDKVKRKSSTWIFNMKNCVFQECGKPEKFLKSMNSNLNFNKSGK